MDLSGDEMDTAGLDFPVDTQSIISGIEESMSEIQSVLSGGPGLDGGTIIPKSYIERLTKFLHENKRHEVPKALKTLAHWENFEEILSQLQPERWSAASIAAMTKYFTAKGKHQAIFYNKNVLLPRIRDDIEGFKQLNKHLLDAMGHAQLKVREFMVGFLLPWLSADDFSTREAKILCSYLAKRSIPYKYMAPVLLQLTRLDFTIPRHLVMLTIFNKAYNFTHLLVQQVAFYFSKFHDTSQWRDFFTDHGHMPIVWYECLLTFLQRYGPQLTLTEVRQMEMLSQSHKHPAFVTPLHEVIVSLKLNSNLRE